MRGKEIPADTYNSTQSFNAEQYGMCKKGPHLLEGGEGGRGEKGRDREKREKGVEVKREREREKKTQGIGLKLNPQYSSFLILLMSLLESLK